MSKKTNILVSPKQASTHEAIKLAAAKKIQVQPDDISGIRILRRSIDARSRNTKINLRIELFLGNETMKDEDIAINYADVHQSEPVIIVGAGPAGLFAALRLIESGIKPIIVERGKQVKERRKDIALLHRRHIVNPESNYNFGEGGAGTFSDGKLYTRSKKRGSIEKILNVFFLHGAPENILIDAHPHLGTDNLGKIVVNMRETIRESGGEIHFNTRVKDFIIKNNTCQGIITANNEKTEAKAVILATGNSARDIYQWFADNNVAIENKDFAIGLRVEHPQPLIDAIQYNTKGGRSKYLPAASYNLAAQIKGRGVFSFCMCPGGYIVPAMTGDKQMVVNGMSASYRNSPFANSGIVTEIKYRDLKEFHQFGALAGIKFQEKIENLAFLNGGNGITAPAQRLGDFVNGGLSGTLPDCSYYPGISSSPMHFWLPDFITHSLRGAFKIFAKKMRGYLTNHAIVLGVETRTSSPIKIIRDNQSLQHPQIKNLYPCGEGAGYAGGIVSSAIDGENCAEKIIDAF